MKSPVLIKTAITVSIALFAAAAFTDRAVAQYCDGPFTASNSAHYSAGRATRTGWFFYTYYANCCESSCDQLGYGSTETTLYEYAPGCYSVEECSSVECYEDSDCDDGVSCTLDSCAANVCVYQPNNALCDDANLCTTDVCDAVAGCQYANIIPCCGNGTCEAGEDSYSCPGDCGAIPPDDGIRTTYKLSDEPPFEVTSLPPGGGSLDDYESFAKITVPRPIGVPDGNVLLDFSAYYMFECDTSPCDGWMSLCRGDPELGDCPGIAYYTHTGSDGYLEASFSIVETNMQSGKEYYVSTTRNGTYRINVAATYIPNTTSWNLSISEP